MGLSRDEVALGGVLLIVASLAYLMRIFEKKFRVHEDRLEHLAKKMSLIDNMAKKMNFEKKFRVHEDYDDYDYLAEKKSLAGDKLRYMEKRYFSMPGDDEVARQVRDW